MVYSSGSIISSFSMSLMLCKTIGGEPSQVIRQYFIFFAYGFFRVEVPVTSLIIRAVARLGKMATTRVATTMMTMVRRFAPPGRVIVVATLVVARELCNSPGLIILTNCNKHNFLVCLIHNGTAMRYQGPGRL